MRPDSQESDTLDDGAGLLAAEAAKQPELLVILLNTISDRVFLKDEEGRVTFVNQAFLSTYDLSAEQVLGKCHHEFLPAEMIGPCLAADRSVLERGEPICLETQWQDVESGAQHWSETHKTPLRDAAGRVVGIVGVSRDITARRSAEKELKRNESLLLHAARLSSLGELAAGIAHEVNQPLFSITNYAKAIENKLQDGEAPDIESVRKWVQQIYLEASRCGKITRRARSYVRPIDSRRESSDINAIVHESIGLMAMEARDAQAQFDVTLTEDLPRLVVDRIQIQQVLVNLLMNALEACSEAPSVDPQIKISTRLTSTSVEVAVADNGPGVTLAEDVDILDPFQTTKHDGVGLGLAISNTIIEAHQGRLTYESNDSGGVTFSFSLPVEAVRQLS